MASKKVLSGGLVVHLLEEMLKSQDGLREEIRKGQEALRAEMERMRVEIVTEQRQTNERLERLEHAAVGVGRVTALEARMRRVEEHVGLAPTNDR